MAMCISISPKVPLTAPCVPLTLCARQLKKFFVSESCHPQTIAVIKQRAEPLGIEVSRAQVYPSINRPPSGCGGRPSRLRLRCRNWALWSHGAVPRSVAVLCAWLD